MIDVQKVNATKERILNTIRASGPTFPARIARETNISPLFIGALLSEMVSERKLVMSSMKVGSSPLYFTPGQEAGLETFTNYLNGKEREAFERLKQSQILDDEAQDPAIRVALRKIKDFAQPLPARIGAEEKLFWKFFTTPEEQAHALIEERINPPAPKHTPRVKEKEQVAPKIVEAPVLQPTINNTSASETIKEKKPKVAKEKVPSAFTKEIQAYLQSKNMFLIQELSTKAKEYHAKISLETPLGPQELLLIAKDKKKVTEDDLAIALHKSQAEKMPSIIVAKGELDKEAQAYLAQWKNLVKYDKLKI
jgi:hypothetical protein